MTFWLLAAGLVALAIAFIVVPLVRGRSGGRALARRAEANAAIYRGQIRELDADLAAGAITPERHLEALREIEARLVEDEPEDEAPARAPRRSAGLAAAVGVAGPLLAIALYLTVGTPGALLTGPQSAENPHGSERRHIDAMVDGLAARLAADPENANGWIMLARSYSALGRFSEAALAYANATARIKDDAQLFADYADTLAMAQGQRLEGEPERLVRTALKLDPDNVKARALAGTAAFNRGDYRGALVHWEHIVRIAPDSEFALSVRKSIAEARGLAGGAKPQERVERASTPAPSPSAAPAGATISGTVRLAPGVSVAPTDTVFVFARPTDGSRMPVAVLRAQAKDLPLQFTLDDRSSMAPGAKLSDQKEVVVGARVSRSGNVTPQAGEPQGSSAAVRPGARGIEIVLAAQPR